MTTTSRPLRVFLCHSSNDKPAVRELYQKLHAEAWIQAWLDEEELHPGQTWEIEIEKAVESSDVVLVCLSNNSINKRGFVQKELRFALDVALEMPEETIFIIPLRLEACVPPRSLRDWQYADYFEGQRERAFQRLLVSLKKRADSLGLKFEEPPPKKEEKTKLIVEIVQSTQFEMPTADWIVENKLTLSNNMEFILVPAGNFIMGSNSYTFYEEPQHTVNIPYDYWMARFTITNELYNTFVKSIGITHPVSDWEKKKDHPIVNLKWKNAMAYCHWLNKLFKAELPTNLILRLPTEAEWEKTARGIDGREYPWGNKLDRQKCNVNISPNFVLRLANVIIGNANTTPVKKYSPQGDSPYGCVDMSGNVFEWTHSLMKAYPYNANDGRENEKVLGNRITRGGSFDFYGDKARCAYRGFPINSESGSDIGFRVCIAPPLPK